MINYQDCCDESAIKMARASFTNIFGKKYSFEQFYELLSDINLALSQIGKQVGLTGERVRQIYKEHFLDIIPNRVKTRTEARIRKITETMPQEGALAVVAKEAVSQGFKVQRIFTSYKKCNGYYNLSKRGLLINGKNCAVYEITAFHKLIPHGKRYYGKFSFYSGKMFDFRIVYAHAEGLYRRMFIFPGNLLEMNKTYYLPDERRPVYNNHYPKIDFWNFENAWYLIRESVN